MKAMIFAAGLGTRLKPITDTIPKALVPVGGTPLLSLIIERLKQFGIDEFVVNVHHFSEQIKDYLADNNNFGVHISISDESGSLLDTGGGIKKARHLLEGSGWFLTHNVDILSNLDIGAFAKNTRQGAAAILAVSDRESSRHLFFDDDMRLSGWINEKTGEIRTHIPDFKPQAYKKLAYSGIQLMHDSIFTYMGNEPEGFPIMDFYIRNAGRIPIYGNEIPSLNLLDVGKVSSLQEAERMCLLLKNP